MKNFTFRSLDNPAINGSINELPELHEHFTAFDHFPKRVLLVCNFCDERLTIGPVLQADPTNQADSEWVSSHRHTIRRWFRRDHLKAATI